MDLTRTFPRSPMEKMAGLVHLPRMLDKAGAFKNHTLGEYIYPCPLDDLIITFLRTDADTLVEMAATQEESHIAEWAATRCRDRTPEEMEAVNREIIDRQPDSDEKRQRFLELRNKIDPSRTEVTTWVNLIDLEEGRLERK